MLIPSQPEWTMSFMNLYAWQAVFSAIQAIILFLVMLVVSAMTIPYERRMLGLWQDRYGPNRVGWQGSLQLVADMLKIFFKEDWTPKFADRTTFMLAPFISMFTALVSFVIIPVSPMFAGSDWNIGILFFFAMAGLSVYAIMFAGWSSGNKFALLGALRSAAQTISYEVFLGLSLMGVVALAGSFNMREIVESQREMWNVIPQFFGFSCFVIAGVAVAHRFPFDLPEAESELAEGYHLEYSGMKFGMFYVGQYVNIVLVSSLITTLFFGGWLPPFGWDIPYIAPIIWFALKTLVFMSLFVLTYASIMRPRYDQIMNFGWKICLPLALINLMITAAVILIRQS